VQLTLNKKDDRLLFDFTGSSPQAKKGINLPYHATFGACYEAILCTLAYDLPKNHGALKPIEVIAKAAKQPMVLESVDLGPLGAEDVEVAVEHRGLYHSDLSVLNNEWGISQYPAILGHEVVGRVTGVGTPNPRPLDAPVTMATSFYWYSHS
jgi:hypothetical protein